MADLRGSCAASRDPGGMAYAAAIGMITGLAHGYAPGRSTEQNMVDIRTVLDALNRFLAEGA